MSASLSRGRMTRSFATLAISLAASAVSGAAFAQTIGVAATVRNEVVQVNGASTAPIDAGEEVVHNEVVRTGRDSAAKLVFRDDTNLAVGPTSTVTLDRFVFSGDGGAGKVSVNLVRGAFRFTTGGLDKKAYEIKTPVATIGVRGTVFDVSSQGGQTIVRLEHGGLSACTRSRSQCATLSQPGETVIITALGVSRTIPGGPRGFTFAAFCGSDGLCAPSQFAAAPSNSSSSVASLCGR